MTKPEKHMLVKELEKHLEPDEYNYEPRRDVPDGVAYIVDVMANMQKLQTKNISTFGELCDNFIQMIDNVARQRNRTDFTMDSYSAGSIKDSERQRRTKVRPIEIASVEKDTPLPVGMDTFWSSNTNKSSLEKLLYDQLADLSVSAPLTVPTIISQIYGSDDHPCVKVEQGEQTEQAHLNSDLDEADSRIIPHIMDSPGLWFDQHRSSVK